MGDAALLFIGSPLFLGSFPSTGKAVARPSSMGTARQPGTVHAMHTEIFQAALVCSPAKQRILFPVTPPQLFL